MYTITFFVISFQDMKKIETIDDVEAFLLKHGENIVDMLGGEIDRIELKLRVRSPMLSNNYSRKILITLVLTDIFSCFRKSFRNYGTVI